MALCQVVKCGSDAYQDYTLRWRDEGVEVRTKVAVCNKHGGELEAAGTTWVMTPDGKLWVGHRQLDLNEYVLLEEPIVAIGGGAEYLAQPYPFGLHLQLKFSSAVGNPNRHR